MKILYNYDKLCFIGYSGCGKTTVVKTIIGHFPRKLILDTNREYEGGSTDNVLELTPTKVQIYRPDEYHVGVVDEFVGQARLFTNLHVVFEDLDLYGVKDFSKPLKALLINGRHQGIGISLIARQINSLPSLAITQSSYIWLWRINPVAQNWAEYRTLQYAIPNLERHFKFTKHEYVIYDMRVNPAQELYHFRCRCPECLK